MAIVAGDIKFRFTTTSGSAGDTTAGAASTSLGKYASTTAWTGGTVNDLFDNVSGAENAASTIDYRALAVLNDHATLTALSISIYLSAEVAGGTSITLAVDDAAASAKGASPAQGDQIANETTAPGAGVGSFSGPTTDGAGISIGDLAPGQVRLIWIKRTAANTSAVTADGFTLGLALDTAA